jgi:predicted ATPase
MEIEKLEVEQEPEVFVNSVTFNDGSTFEFKTSDVVVFTGANNAGKSQVLRDILLHLQGRSTTKVIVSELKGDFTGSIEKLIEGAQQSKDGRGQCFIGEGYHHPNHVRNWWSNSSLGSISGQFVNYLTTEQRLVSSNSPASFDSTIEPPRNPIQRLFIDDDKAKELSSFFHQAFGLDLIVDKAAGNIIPLYVGNEPSRGPGEDRTSTSYRKRLALLPKLQEQGDGMRSFAGILLDTFTSHHTITLIDEPEAFLHPPQARLLGKMLAKNTPENRQLFISTHSEDFLKGLLDADNENVKIIRINRVGNTNHMNILNNEDIKQLWKDPILRYSNILSGLFHSKVVICESDTDCRFYQAVMNALHDGENEISPDVLFTHCGGKQRLKTVISSLQSLNVKIVAVADIDILNDRTILKNTTDSLHIEWSTLDALWSGIDGYVKSQRAQLDTDEVKKEIKGILQMVTNDPFPVDDVDKIKTVLKSSTAWSKIKKVGKNFFQGDSYEKFIQINDICSSKGLFIVPAGELECFYRPSSSHGTKWVYEVLEKIDLKTDPELKEARDFVSKIIDF